MSEKSEMSETYQGLVKHLKPFDIVVEKISDHRLSQLKVVDDPNLIKDEDIVIVDKPEEEEDEDEEEEIEINLKEAELFAENQIKEDSPKYLCFMCKKTIGGYSEALIHYQLHIDYFPIQCSVCDEANTDILSFVKHCRRIHPELESAKYILKNNSVFFDWIHTFLTTEPNISQVHKYCPVCDWTHLFSQKDESTPKAIPIITHIHQHIQYMPFECIKCRENGRQFRVHYLDYTIRSHIVSEHKELEPPFWTHFSKKYTIPSLDKFVVSYLTILGIKLPKKRNTKRRTKPNSPPVVVNGTPTPQIVVTTASANSLAPKPALIQPKPVPFIMNSSPTLQNLLLPINQINRMISNQMVSQTIANGKSVITYNLPITKTVSITNPLQMIDPLMILPSNDKINLKPTYVESTELSIICVDPKIVEIEDKSFKYICVFCEEEKVFASKIEMCVHYNIHFSYYPVVCMLCSKTFLDMSTLLHHYNKSHVEYKNNLFHYLKEDEKIEKWIDCFVDFQKTHEFRANVSVAFGDYCFVCQKFVNNKMPFDWKCLKDQMKGIRDHIHQHLHYFPYKCLICFHGNRTVRFTSLNSSAVNHMNKLHGLNTTEISLTKLFAKTDEILELEKFIESKLFPKRAKTSETPIILNLKRKLEQIEIEAKKCSESPRLTLSSTLPTLPSAQVLPMVRYDDNNKKPKTNSNSEIHSNSVLKISTTSSPQKQLNANYMRVTAITPKPIEYIPNRLTYIEPYLLCFHCHQKVSNTKELESHHQSKHPKLTIASYAPTKRDLINWNAIK